MLGLALGKASLMYVLVLIAGSAVFQVLRTFTSALQPLPSKTLMSVKYGAVTKVPDSSLVTPA